MGSPSNITAAESFFDLLRSPPTSPRAVLVNTAAMRRDAQAGLSAAERLRGYGAFLEQVRSTKAKFASSRFEVDRELRRQSRRALQDVNTLAVSTLRIVRNMHGGGALASVMDSFRSSLQRSSAGSVSEIWEHATSSTESRAMLKRAGISDAMREAFDATVRTADLRVSADARGIAIVGFADGAFVKAEMTTAPRSAPSGLKELLFMGRFDVLADAFENREPAYLAGLALPDNEPRPEEVALAGVLVSYHDTVRHIRKLEDIGFDNYRGASGATAGFIVVLVLMIAGFIVGQEECPTFTTLTEGGSSDSFGCGVAKVLYSLGLFLLLFLILRPSKTDPSNTGPVNLTGSPVVRGVVRDFVLEFPGSELRNIPGTSRLRPMSS